MTTAFQSDSFQVSAFQIDSGANLSLVALEGADLCAGTLSVALAGASFSLMATDGADTFSGALSFPFTVGKPLSWIVLPSRVYTQKVAAKAFIQVPFRTRILKSN